jgi:flagellar L-ring protein precursor FlgH
MIHVPHAATRREMAAIVPTRRLLGSRSVKRVSQSRLTRTLVFVLAGLVAMLILAQALAAQQPRRGQAPAVDSAALAREAAVQAYNWFGDRRTFAVGDIIRVAVDESALASATKNNVAESSRSRTMGVGIEPPSTGAEAAMGNIEGNVRTSDAGNTRQRGEAVRGTRYVGEIPVRVVAVTKEGLLQVKGTKTIDVDKNKQVMQLTGFVRPQDVNAQDIVESAAVADAQLSYQSKGGLGKPKNGIITKILGIFWP